MDNNITYNIKFFQVKKDEKDSVARRFLEKSEDLRAFLNKDIYDNKKRITNIKRYERNRKKKRFRYIILKIKRVFNRF